MDVVGTAHRMSCAVVKVGSVQLRECDLNYNSAALCSDARGRQLTSKLIGVLQMHQSSFPTWFRSLLIGQLGTRFKAKGAGNTCGWSTWLPKPECVAYRHAYAAILFCEIPTVNPFVQNIRTHAYVLIHCFESIDAEKT